MTAMQTIRFGIWSAVATALLVVAGCDSGSQSHANAFPMGELPQFDQPKPSKPLFGSDNYMRAKDVLPSAKVEVREPLPPAVPLPTRLALGNVVQPTMNAGEAAEKQGGVTPAAGMAAGVTGAQGGGEKSKLDGTAVK